MKQAAATTADEKPVDENATLALGLLVAEAEDGSYEPVAMVSTIREAREVAGQNFRNRMIENENGGDPLYPARYAVWQQSREGGYRIVSAIETN